MFSSENVHLRSHYHKEKSRYETYAFICWNFCETIYDKMDDDLMRTWSVVIENENRLHRRWFEQAENQSKFKKEFRDFISTNYRL